MPTDENAIQDYLEAVKSWRWRIIRTGHNLKTFAKLIEVNPSQLSVWVNGKLTPTLTTFSKVEGKLKELEHG